METLSLPTLGVRPTINVDPLVDTVLDYALLFELFAEDDQYHARLLNSLQFYLYDCVLKKYTGNAALGELDIFAYSDNFCFFII